MSINGTVSGAGSVKGNLSGAKVLNTDSYAIALANGFEGTVEEWLKSLKGEPGPQGPQGDPGEKGADGKTPVKGEDYFTPEEVQEIAEQAAALVEVPDSSQNVDLTGYATEQYVQEYAQPKGNYLTEHQDLSGYAKTEDIPTKVSELENDEGYLTDDDLNGYAKTEDIPDVSGLAKTEDIPSVPSTLPNPHALTFTGAVEATYDGSGAVSVEIPSGGGSSDTWEEIFDVTVPEDCISFEQSIDTNGNPFELVEAMIFVHFKMPETPLGTRVYFSLDSTISNAYNNSPFGMDSAGSDYKNGVHGTVYIKRLFGKYVTGYYTRGAGASMPTQQTFPYNTGSTMAVNSTENAFVMNDMKKFRMGGYNLTIGAGTRVRMFGRRA